MGQGLVNGSSNIFLGLITICLIPTMLRGLGTKLFGLWLFVSMIANVGSIIADLGVTLTVMREVGAVGSDTDRVAQFVRAAANFYLRLAITGALVIIASGAWLLSRHETIPEIRMTLTKVLIVVSVGFVADKMCSFQLSVLQGLRRLSISPIYLQFRRRCSMHLALYPY